MARGSSRGSAIMGPLCVCALCFFTATFVGPLGANAPRGCRTRRQVATETETAFETETEPVEVEDFYELLGVSEEADVKEIKAAFRQAARLTHPDFFRTKPKEEREKAQERFTQVNKAFEVLTDPKKRQAYDLRGLAGLAEFEFNGERIIMPPPWRVRVGYTGHHFWKMKEYFVGFMLETLPDVSHEVILSAFEEATKDPIGVGQAILVDRCTEKHAKDVVEALQEYGLVCMCEEVPDEELREEEDEEEAEEPKPKPVVKQAPTQPKPKPQPVVNQVPPTPPKPQPQPVVNQVPPTPPKPQPQPPVVNQVPPTPPKPKPQPVVNQAPPTPPKPKPLVDRTPSKKSPTPISPSPAPEPPLKWRWPHSARSPPCYQASEVIFKRRR
ncbi:unnamed protein product [Durusdinium trenchii]|uniref:J domain-containing protein n=1 Tax=Durusdinium trenchii TaxID=1381693 RepID=A0ABP0JF11_9DINO